MKKYLLASILIFSAIGVFAFEYIPKDVNANPFGNNKKPEIKAQEPAQPEMREIKNLTEYFRYLPNHIHRNWTPYHSKSNYEVTVQFHISRKGEVSNVEIINSTNPEANRSVLKAVKSASPLQPLPKSFSGKDGVTAQIVLEYKKPPQL